MEYVPTNLPRYWKIHPRDKFKDIIVQEDHVLIFSEDGQSLTARLPDGTFKRLGSNSFSFDFSSATAEAQHTLSSFTFYNSSGLLTTGTIPTVSASIVQGAVVVPSGYIASSQEFPIGSGESAADVTLGYISGGLFYQLAFSGTSSYVVTSSAGLSNYIWNLPVVSDSPSVISDSPPITPTPGTGSAVIYSSGGSIVSSADVMNGVIVASAGSLRVYSGGTANSTTVNDQGYLFVSSGGIANYTTLNSVGFLYVLSGATALAVTSKLGANIVVSDGGYIEYVNA